MCRLVVVDVGNSAVKWSVCRVQAAPDGRRAAPDVLWTEDRPHVWRVPPSLGRAAAEGAGGLFDELLRSLPDVPVSWCVASVHRGLEARLASEVRRARPGDPYRRLRAGDFPLALDVEAPEAVGADRLAAAVAANACRDAARGAIIVDAGTAVTVDLLTADGVFRGGAILPGMPTAARALHLVTDGLPMLADHAWDTLPPPLGKSTEAAMRSGIVWGCVAAVRELVAQLADGLSPAPEVFCTGGAGQLLAGWLNRPVTRAPLLVLHGIALAGYHQLRCAAGSG